MYAKPLYSDQFKRNDDEFRNTMEAIFQKYSRLNDPGIDVCLRTMTCRTVRGPVAIDSAEGERELEALKTQVKADCSMMEFEDQDNDQMDVSTEDDLDSSGQKENSENLWHGGESFQLSENLKNTSHGSLWAERSQPKEEDEELEKTLSSHSSTLLDVYPSMLNQIGEAYRRQHVTDTARAVVQKYRRKHWQAGPTHRNSSFKSRQNSTLIKTTDISFPTQSPAQRNISNCFKGSDKLQNLLMNKSSPLRNSSYEASACFYSPRRTTADVSGVTDESPWTDLHSTRKPDRNTPRVIDLTTPPYSGSPSSPDLDQTYNVGPTTNAVPASSVFTSPRQSRAGLPVIGQRGTSIISWPSSLDKDCFRDRLHSSVSSPQRLIGVLSPSGRSSFRPSVLNVERQLNLTASPKRKSPVHLAHSEALTSPYGAKHVPLLSPRRSVYNRADQSTPPYSGSPSSPDLDQTYDVGSTTNALPASSVFTSPRQSRAGLPVIDQRGMSIISQHSLDKDCFRDRLHSSVSSPQRLIGVLSPSGKSSFRPSVLNVERQLNSTASPKRKSPVHLAHSEALGSPYDVKHEPLSSPRRSVYDRADQSLSKLVKPSHFTPFKRQRSLSGPQSTLAFSEPQIDAEFRKLYHHFICRGSSSPCPSSHCHLCERHMKETSRSPSFSSSSMSALALTPLRAKLKKRQRQPEVEESLRFKRFRESRSPLKHLQLTGRCVSAAMSELTEDKLTWDRAVLLQCPSPRFLRGTGNLRRIREAKLSMKKMNPHTLSWRDAPSEVQPVEAAVSPMRPCIQGTAQLSPSLSRRRLQYGLLQ